jgi:hypothetical protein
MSTATVSSNSKGEPKTTSDAGEVRAGEVRAWAASMTALTSAAESYRDEVGAAGPRTLGSRWDAASAALKEKVDSAVDDSLASMLGVLDRLEDAHRRIAGAVETLLDSNVITRASHGMSRSFSERLAILIKEVKSALATMGAARHATILAMPVESARFSEDSASSVAAAFGTQRGSIATELYVRILAALQTPEASKLLEDAKDQSLGGTPDAVATAAADSKALAEYHPSQAMTYAPTVVASPADVTKFQITMPGATLSTTYDLERLTSRKRALEFGPIAATTAGLSYKLVDRLRTIAATPAAKVDASAVPRDLLRGPIQISERVCIGPSLEKTATPPLWAPFGGCQPRADAYAAVSSEVIMEQMRAEIQRADRPPDIIQQSSSSAPAAARFEPEVLVAEYETAVNSGDVPQGDADPDTLVRLLTAEFASQYDLTPPGTPGDLFLLIAPEEPAGTSYISKATAQLSREVMGKLLRTYFRSIVTRRLATPYAALEREARLTQSLFAIDAALDIWRRFRSATWVDSETFVTGDRDAHVRHFKKLATKVVQSAPIRICPPSLKLYYALHV